MKQNNSQIKGWAVALTIFLIIALAIVGCVFNNSFVKKTDDHSVQKENSDNTTTMSSDSGVSNTVNQNKAQTGVDNNLSSAPQASNSSKSQSGGFDFSNSNINSVNINSGPGTQHVDNSNSTQNIRDTTKKRK